MLFQALGIHTAAEKPKDREWVFILLNFLKAYVQDLGKELLMDDDYHVSYVTDLIHALHEATRDAETGKHPSSHPMRRKVCLTLVVKSCRNMTIR